MNRRSGPTVVIDWDRFYSLRDEELDQKIGTRKLMSNQEAVLTGLLACKYFTLDPFFRGAKFLISLCKGEKYPIILVTNVFSFTRIR